ncbi:hypothetical protein [Candidatus Dactylopiibacterium carminicum]|nr:hypothetical protein [Candidatus Dactylopiibacterium carminicum]
MVLLHRVRIGMPEFPFTSIIVVLVLDLIRGFSRIALARITRL